MIKKYIFSFLILTSFGFAASYDAREPDDGRPKVSIPGSGGATCCTGTMATSCAMDIIDSYGVMTDRVRENLERLERRWNIIYDEYVTIRNKSIPMTANTIEQEIMQSERIATVYQTSYEAEKYNKLVETELELNNLSGSLKFLTNEISVLKVKEGR